MTISYNPPPSESFESFKALDSHVSSLKESEEKPLVEIDSDPGPSQPEEKEGQSTSPAPLKEEPKVKTEDREVSEEPKESEEPEELEEPASKKIEWETKSGKKFSADEQELKNAFALYSENKKRMSELDVQKKEVETSMKKVKEFESFVKDIQKLEGTQLLQTALEELNRVNPKLEAAFQAYYDSIFKEAESVVKMTPQEREIYETKKKVAFHEKQESDRKQKELQAQRDKVVNQRLSSIKETWKVDDDLLDRATTLAHKQKWINEKTSHDEALNILEEIVAEYTFEQRASEVLKKVGADSEDLSALNDLIDWQFRNQKAGKKDLEARAAKLFAPPPAIKRQPQKKKVEEKTQMQVLRGNQMPEGSTFST